jgi:hypothetical protein
LQVALLLAHRSGLSARLPKHFLDTLTGKKLARAVQSNHRRRASIQLVHLSGRFETSLATPQGRNGAKIKKRHRAKAQESQATRTHRPYHESKMAKLKKQPKAKAAESTSRNVPATTPRPVGIARVPKANKYGKNHGLTIEMRNVVRFLMAPNKLDMSATNASTVFNHIFRNKPLTPMMLRGDWATRRNKRGDNMYGRRVLKLAGSFTREEIIASEEAATQIRNACRTLKIALPDDADMEEDMGQPTDATVLHPSLPLSRLPRGMVDDHVFPIGYQPRPPDYVDSRTKYWEDHDSLKWRVMMQSSTRRHTRRQLDRSNILTPSAEPRVVDGTFVATADTDDSDLEGQAEERRMIRVHASPAEQ